MTLQFNIHYNTLLGQHICVCGSSSKLGKWNTKNALKMNYGYGGHWHAQVKLNSNAENIQYKYFLTDSSGVIIWEDGVDRTIRHINNSTQNIIAKDSWRAPSNEEKVMFTSAFAKALMKPNSNAKPIAVSKAKKTIQFKIQAPRISSGYMICVLGNQPKLGNWDQTKPLLLGCGDEFPLWTGSMAATGVNLPIRYKYGIYNITEKKVVTIEEGLDREIKTLPEEDYLHIQSDESFK